MSQILNQMLYILLPIFIYFSVVKDDNSIFMKYEKTFIAILCWISLLLCMTFPVSFAAGNQFDLRTIPWLVSFLYGSVPVGLISTALLIIYRFIIGGPGFYGALIVYSSMLIPLLFYFKNYKNFSYKKKLKSILLFNFFNSLLVLLVTNYMFKFFEVDAVFFSVVFILVNLFTTWMAVHIIEVLREKYFMEERLLKSEKLNLVGQMAASVAHEIRNPMTTVHGFLQLMYQDHATSSKQKEQLHIMRDELSRAESIISDYLTLAKPEADTLELVDLKEQFKRIQQSIAAYATLNDVSVLYHIEELDGYCVKGSSEKVQQVLINMIKNAIEVSPKCSSVEVFLSQKEMNEFEIIIKDVGMGMSKETLAKLGTPFYSLKEDGTGLGLTVCYRIVDSMGGRIDVNSELGVGTTFSVTLPRNCKIS